MAQWRWLRAKTVACSGTKISQTQTHFSQWWSFSHPGPCMFWNFVIIHPGIIFKIPLYINNDIKLENSDFRYNHSPWSVHRNTTSVASFRSRCYAPKCDSPLNIQSIFTNAHICSVISNATYSLLVQFCTNKAVKQFKDINCFQLQNCNEFWPNINPPSKPKGITIKSKNFVFNVQQCLHPCCHLFIH